MIFPQSRLSVSVSVPAGGRTRPTATVLVVMLLVIGLIAGVGVGGVLADEDTHEQSTNVTPPPHLHPDEVDEDGDLEAVKWWYGWYMGDQLAASAINTSEESHTQAQAAVGPHYPRAHNHYVNVSEEIAGLDEPADDRDTFTTARDRQERFATDVETFWEQYDAFEMADAGGETTEARQLARQLAVLGTDIERTGEDLLTNYDRIEAADYRDMSDARSAVLAVLAEIGPVWVEAVDEYLVETEVQLDATPTASYLEPLAASGTVHTTDGEPVADGTVDITIHNVTYTVVTDETGAFDVDHRPVTMWAGNATVTASYQPAPESDHLGSDDRVDIVIEQITPNIQNLSVTSPARFGDTVSVQGTLRVGHQPVFGAPMDITLDDRPVDRTTANGGTFNGSFDVPASLPVGEHRAGAAFPYENRAIAAVAADRELVILPTDTAISLSTSVTGEELRLTGDLVTEDDLAVPDQPVAIGIGNTSQETVYTDEEGRYAVILDVGERVEASTVVVQAQFDGEETNLHGSTSASTVELPATMEEETDADPATLLWWFVVLILLLLTLYAVKRWWSDIPRITRVMWMAIKSRDVSIVKIYRKHVACMATSLFARFNAWRTPGTETGNQPPTDVYHSLPRSLLDQTPLDFDGADTSDEPLLDGATRALADGRTGAAVVLSYAAVRERLGSDEADRYLTHREFHEKHRDHNGHIGATQLEAITEGFEIVVYAERSLDTESAAGYLEQAKALCRT